MPQRDYSVAPRNSVSRIACRSLTSVYLILLAAFAEAAARRNVLGLPIRDRKSVV